MNYQPKNLLVTGGAGFIGANFIQYMLKNHREINIVNLDKLTYAGSLAHLNDIDHLVQYHFIQGDICDRGLVDHLLQHHRIDTIVHFAAESHVDRSISEPEAFVQTNIVGTYQLLEAARHHWQDIDNCQPAKCRFHHISTDEVYGSLYTTDPAFSETTPYDPHSPYSASKASSDHLVKAYFHTYNLPITISNCSNNYGPYQHREKFIPTIIDHCLNMKPIPVYGNGKNIRDWLYVTDHCRAIDLIINRGQIGQTYNVGGHNEWENIDIATLICRELDTIKPGNEKYENLIEFVADRPGHDFRYAIDDTKIKEQLGWTAQETMQSGIQKTIRYYLT